MAINQLSAAELAEVREIFGHFDKNGNGVIERDEFVSLLEALDADLTEEQINAGLEALDKNRNGLIEFQEFIDWWAEK